MSSAQRSAEEVQARRAQIAAKVATWPPLRPEQADVVRALVAPHMPQRVRQANTSRVSA